MSNWENNRGDLGWNRNEYDSRDDGVGSELYEDTEDAPRDLRTIHEARAVPPTMDDEDGGDQDRVTRRIVTEGMLMDGSGEGYKSLNVKKISVADLRDIWQRQSKTSAIKMLIGDAKREVHFPEEFMYRSACDQALAWRVDETAAGEAYLDYLALVPREMGLDSVLPNITREDVANGLDWTFTIDSGHRHWEYRADLETLGVDAAGKLLHVGTTGAAEDVWLLFTKVEQVGREVDMRKVEATKESTRMSPVAARVVWAMISWMLVKIHYGALDVAGWYPDVSSDYAFGNSSPVLGERRRMLLNLQQVISLNEAIKNRYDEWWQGAPEEYKLDELEGTVPLAIRVRYGQNQVISSDGLREEDAQHWDRLFDVSKMLRLHMAIAKHYSCFEATAWDPIDVEDITGTYDEIYETRHQTRPVHDLETLRLVDDDGEEIHIFDREGWRIPRRQPVVAVDRDGNIQECGLLQKLSKVQGRLFAEDGDYGSWRRFVEDLEGDEGMDLIQVEGGEPVPLTFAAWADGRPLEDEVEPRLFPHLYTKDSGQWQADGIIKPMRRFVYQVHRALRAQAGRGLCVEPVRSQCYNTLAHHTRASSRLHVAQRGILTGTAAGAWERSAKGARTAKTLFDKTSLLMPHRRLEDLVGHAGETFLRLEEEYVFHVTRFSEETQTGAALYTDAIHPLIRAGRHPDVLDALKDTTVVLTQEAWPNVYSWVTYPITALMTTTWDTYLKTPLEDRTQLRGLSPRSAPSNEAMALTPQTPYVELIAVLERALNFAYTGAAKVLCQTLMGKLWVGKALQDGFMPVFCRDLKLGRNQEPLIALTKWPMSKRKQPLVASKRSQVLTYGEDHFQRYLGHITIMRTLAVTTDDSGGTLAIDEQLFQIGLLVVRTYIQDVQALIKSELDALSHAPGLQEGSVEDLRIQQRMAEFEAWKDVDHPLDWGEGKRTYMMVTRIAREQETDLGNGLPPSNKERSSVEDLAERMFKVGCGADRRSIVAPVWKGGDLRGMLQIAVTESRARIQAFTEGDQQQMIVSAWVKALKQRRVQFVPDQVGNDRSPSLKGWTILSEAHDARLGGLVEASRTPLERQHTQLAIRAREASRTAVNAGWTATSLKIGEYGDYLDRQVAPDDACARDEQGKNALVNEVYQWVDGEIKNNATEWRCQLAFVLAFLLTKVTPTVFLPTKGNGKLDWVKKELGKLDEDTQHKSVGIMRQVILERSKDGKGATDKRRYFGSAVAVILAFIHPDSPLRTFWTAKGQLSNDWTKKQRAKGLGVAMLVRLGVLKGHGAALVGAAKLQHWSVQDDKALQTWLQTIKGQLRMTPKGPWGLMTELFGFDAAKKLADKDEFPGLPPVRERTGSDSEGDEETSRNKKARHS
ncbi:hypothetical protein LXA43DRAFT_1167648 [Ganoderma leucocontextum]|nr:hypothetical protein LXA43DRAFT_1121302 [Ganoderma leucocontextum]KAI1787169.1 hypothetical protein LXA43DRAFT_1167648 [Ganoderma leucocontextum]